MTYNREKELNIQLRVLLNIKNYIEELIKSTNIELFYELNKENKNG